MKVSAIEEQNKTIDKIYDDEKVRTTMTLKRK